MSPADIDPQLRSKPGAPTASRSPKSRIPSIDLVRGIVMVLMALDHTRDFFGPELPYEPTNLTHASAALFLTRLVTHLCAPTFIFLAGTSAWLSGRSERSRAERSRHLLTRGLWLILLELTVVHFGWSLWHYQFIMLQVIWALGWCMIVLAALIWLPKPVIAGIGAGMVLLHNLLDRWWVGDTILPPWLWSMLHVPSSFPLGAHTRIVVIYPLIPWIGVMALGYLFGAMLQADPASRSRRFVGWGLAAWAAFVLLRASRLYGDPMPWMAPAGRNHWFTLLAFFNTEKYPPSLLYLLMTLGTMFLLLALAEGWHPRTPVLSGARGVLLTFGRVPLCFYIAHLILIHTLRILDHYARSRISDATADSGYPLSGVYAVWAIVLLLLYPLCARYDAYKRTHPRGWTRWV